MSDTKWDAARALELADQAEAAHENAGGAVAWIPSLIDRLRTAVAEVEALRNTITLLEVGKYGVRDLTDQRDRLASSLETLKREHAEEHVRWNEQHAQQHAVNIRLAADLAKAHQNYIDANNLRLARAVVDAVRTRWWAPHTDKETIEAMRLALAAYDANVAEEKP